MASRARCILFLFSLLLCGSLGAEHRRQKRGLVKMMMHVMWDPVRLIRYWYAYDVTKEIAKSWRKIIPTMVLHPYLGDAPGFAKYLHPTHGLVRTTHKKQTGQFKYPDGHHADGQLDYIQSLIEQSEAPVNTYGSQPEVQSSHGYLHTYQEQPESSKNLGTSYGDRLPHSHILVESASSSMDQPKFRVGYHYGPQETAFAFGGMDSHKDAHHVYLQPVVHQEFKRDNRGRLPPEGQSSGYDDGKKWAAGSMQMPLPYHINVPSRGGEQHVVLKTVPVPTFFHSSEEVAGDHAASSNIDSARTKNVHLGTLPDQFGSGSTKTQQGAKLHSGSHPVFLGGDRQEIHIVLHPIPVREGDPHRGQPVNFLPYIINGNESSLANKGPFSLASPHEMPSSYEEHSFSTLEPPTKVNSKTMDKNESKSESNSTSVSAEVYDAKQTSRVTWVLKKSKTPDRLKIVESDTDGTTVEPNSVDHTPQHPLRLKGQRIDIEQLREDLKHGTPVLIPFDKKVELPRDTKRNHTSIRNPFVGGPLNIRGEIQYGSPPRLPQETTLQVEEESPHYSSEEYADNRATQRLLLFLAKKHTSQHRR